MAPRRGNIDTIGQTQLRELSGGTFATKLVTTDESAKTTGNILTVDDNGNVVDSGVAATAVETGAVFGASGSGHAAGAVPDPGSTAGSTRFLCEDTTWAVPPGTGSGSGSVTSVALTVPSWLSVSGSPITTSGTLVVTATSGQTANQVLATPNGSSGAASLRALAAADIPNLATSKITSGTFSTDRLGSGTADSTVFLRGDGAWATPAGGGSGSVSSVGLTVPSWLSVSGSPVTTSGTLAITATTGETANRFLATPDGSTGAVGLRAITAADLPLATTGAFGAVKPDGTTITISGGVITSTSSGGMTNPMTTAGDIIYGGTSGTPTRLAGGTSGYVLTSNGATSAPSWQAATGGSGSGPTVTQLSWGSGSTLWSSNTWYPSTQTFTGFKHLKIRAVLNRSSTSATLAIAISSNATTSYQFSAQSDGNLVWYYNSTTSSQSVIQASSTSTTQIAGNTYIELEFFVFGSSVNMMRALKDMYLLTNAGSTLQVSNSTNTSMNMASGTFTVYVNIDSTSNIVAAYVETF
jgi:hypothetical protein